MKIGAASKGIIQRDFQHHATVFKSPYAKNPFDSVSNDELEEYKRIIDRWAEQRRRVSSTAPSETLRDLWTGQSQKQTKLVVLIQPLKQFLSCSETHLLKM